MILSVVIPQYKETEENISKLLYSINYQLNVNWKEVEVIIVNDGSNVILSDDFLNSFSNIKPKYIKLEKNVGPGLCRQAGLDAAIGDYVTFCDADDIYQNFGVFSLYLSVIRTKHPDIIVTNWLEEMAKDGNLYYLQHDFDATWMHGKVFNRGYLYLNNIRFNPKLWYHEDSHFLGIAMELTQNVERLQQLSYVWLYDASSITRRNNAAYTYEALPEFIRSIDYTMEILMEKKPEKIPFKIGQLCIYIYYSLQQNKWSEENVNFIEDEIARVFIKYKPYFDKLTDVDIYNIITSERAKAKIPFIESETFVQFIQRIIAKYTKNHEEVKVE